ncbi:MAG: nitrate ABC transporter substrate-binding protein [Myxococcales bacterium]|nr:MAG: nitrate ABC transporter substrate-binding protein [Myxococcales bacterium]
MIRVGYPGVGIGNRPASYGNSVTTLHLKGLLEEEFKKDGIKVQWTFLRGAGPAVNELFANGLLDFSHLGDLPSVVGRASGLKYRVLASSGVRNNIYVSVPADSTVQSVKDLRGKKVAVLKGTATHLAGVKILEKFGLSEKDVRLVNLDTNAAKAALVTKDIDAAVGGPDYLSLRDQGVSRVIFTTKSGDPKLTTNALFLGSQDFIEKYPDITLRVIKQLVLAAKLLADAEKDPTSIFQLWTKSGFTFSGFKEDWKGEDLKYRTSPLVDPYVASRYRLQIEEAQRFGLTRRGFSFEEWTELKFLKQALKELGLEQNWKPRGLDGKPTG